MTEEPPGWRALLTRDGLDTLRWIAGERGAGRAASEINSSLRARGLPADQVAALLTQALLREKARTKFGDRAEQFLFTQAGLEQATRSRVAASHAERFRAAGCTRIADLGCGIGAESLALLEAGLDPLAVELNPLTAEIASHNLRVAAALLGRPEPEVQVGDAEQIGPEDADGVFLDPARRTAGHSNTRRVSSPDDYSPSLTFAFHLASRLPTGIKLGPGFDRELIPDQAEAQWVSVDGQVVEMGLWFGAAARPGVHRAALVLNGATGSAELTASEDSADAGLRELGEYLYEPDGAVIRARLIGRLAADLNAGMLSDGIAYLTTDQLVPTPFAQVFRVVETLPSREKVLRRALGDRGIGSLEIKKRGADVDPAALRKRLKLRGDNHATLFLTRSAGKHVALLAERC
ncbi:class I SAM-dependent methyltransferase [Leucobacter coleopterorum]|uniref:Class I SAM-dependent methyltransferase n=1 Tax=Leucobacter coleopterorum TaxID=2714933 RepID=A0ABX6JV78_9MICO|nr:class I SAM-dependent methyltransferase [Leucobacter coleopterorum]QIM18167.1 class I SAM-dependent methyltransferase [Leucobacter coleopterorum]